MKLLVTGGRTFGERTYAWQTLDLLHAENPITLLIHGQGKGADTIADEWAKERGVQRVLCPADWQNYPDIAGPRRSRLMLELGPDKVLAFAGGAGTAYTVKLAHEKKIPVLDLRNIRG